MQPGSCAAGREAGFTYLGLLALVVLIGLLLAAAGEVVATSMQRDHEAELLWVGHAYRDAIGRYFAHYGRYPTSLADLVGDSGDTVLPFRAIRRLYRDPMTNGRDWVLVPGLGGGIMGVTSASTRSPLKHAGFDAVDNKFADAEAYANWSFIYDPNAAPVPGRRRTPVASPTP